MKYGCKISDLKEQNHIIYIYCNKKHLEPVCRDLKQFISLICEILAAISYLFYLVQIALYVVKSHSKKNAVPKTTSAITNISSPFYSPSTSSCAIQKQI